MSSGDDSSIDSLDSHDYQNQPNLNIVIFSNMKGGNDYGSKLISLNNNDGYKHTSGTTTTTTTMVTDRGAEQ